MDNTPFSILFMPRGKKSVVLPGRVIMVYSGLDICGSYRGDPNAASYRGFIWNGEDPSVASLIKTIANRPKSNFSPLRKDEDANKTSFQLRNL